MTVSRDLVWLLGEIATLAHIGIALAVTMFVFLLLAARYFEMTARTRSLAMQEQLAIRAPLYAERLTNWPSAEAEKVVRRIYDSATAELTQKARAAMQ